MLSNFKTFVNNCKRTLARLDAANKPTAVRDFIGTGAVAVGLAINPTSPGIYYVNFSS